MKKILIGILLICGCVGLFFFIQAEQKEELQASDVLPADTMLYLEQHDFVKLYNEFASSRLGRVLSKIDYEGIAAELDGDGQVARDAVHLWKELHDVINEPVYDQVLGKEVSIALLSMPLTDDITPEKFLEERLLLIAKPRHNAKVVQFFASYLAKDVEQSTVQYGTHSIQRYKLNEKQTLSTAAVDGLVLAAYDERLVRKSLNIYDERQNTLSSNEMYNQLRQRCEGSVLFQFFAVSAVRSQLEILSQRLPEEQQQQFHEFLNEFNGWEAGAYAAWKEEGSIKDTLEIIYTREKLDPYVADLLSQPPEHNNSLKMVPSDALFYYWGNSLNLPLIFELYSEAIIEEQPEAFDLLQQELQDSVGMPLEEILALVANEYGVIIKQVEGEGVPIPKALVLFKLNDTEKVGTIIKTLLAEADIPISSNSYMDREINYWGVAPQVGLQPAYTISGDYLLLSNSRDLVKQVVSLQDGAEGTLLVNTELQQLSEVLKRENNTTAYAHIAHMADSLKTLATWAGGMAVLQGQETAKDVNVIVQELVLPLLDGIAMFTQMATRSEVKETTIVLESTILVVDETDANK